MFESEVFFMQHAYFSVRRATKQA